MARLRLIRRLLLRFGEIDNRSRVLLPEAVQQSRHRSVQQAARCYNEGEIAWGRAVRLV